MADSNIEVLIAGLGKLASRGSKPRCHLLTHGTRERVSDNLTRLVAPVATVSCDDTWMPVGFDEPVEAQLDKAAHLLPDPELRLALARWWLPPELAGKRTPNIDIAFTCRIGSTSGIALVEAKAHHRELEEASAGRSLPGRANDDTPADRARSRETISAAIEEARKGLAADTGLAWGINCDRCYQISNRFAWAWKLAALGVPTVLVYLGFIDAVDMDGRLIENEGQWRSTVLAHSQGVIPEEVWGGAWSIEGTPFHALIRAQETPLSLMS